MLRLLLCVAIALGVASCQERARTSEVSSTTTNPLLQRVAPKNVCMANDRFMTEPQIEVVVNGSVYYGCCPMCERRLRDEAEIRTATDPVSRRPVDKAKAVIGKLKSGKVLYFESEATFAAYRQRT